ncbi:tetratricopeptide repeat protein [bacterium]|nr:tetratricopeptide repeat protein [bacterium]
MLNKEIVELERKLELLRQKTPCVELAAVLNKLAFLFLHLEPHKSKVYAREAQDLAEKLGFLVELARSNTILGVVSLETGNFTEAMSFCRKSMKIYEKLDDNTGKASVHATIANIYRVQGMIDKALENYHESLRIRQKYCDDKNELARCHFNIGACYSSLLRLDLAQSAYEYAQEIWEKSGDPEKLAYLYNNIGSVYGKRKELDKAQEFFQKALTIREDLGDKKGVASTLGNLGSLNDKLGNNESALGFFIRSLALYEEIGNKRGIAHTCGCIGVLYTTLKNLDKAEKFIKRGLEITRKLKVKDLEIQCLEQITSMYEKKGDLRNALKYSKEFNICLVEYMNEKSMEKIAKLQVQFETEKLSKMNDQLRDTLALVKKLQGLLPICANCKKIRKDDGYWQQIESYITDHSEAMFSHGLCPECSIKLYGEDFNLDND